MATVAVEVAFGSTYQSASPTWTAITDYVIEARAKRGRSRGSASMEPGEIVVVVNNRDDRFTPTNTGSPYSPNVTPGCPIRLRKYVGSTWYTVATAYVDSWRPQWNERPATCTVTAYDFLREAELAGPAQLWRQAVLADSPTWFWTFDEWSGESADIAVDVSGNGYDSDAGATWPLYGKADGIIVGEAGYGLDGTQNLTPDELVQSASAARISGTESFTFECVYAPQGADLTGIGQQLFDQRTDVTTGVTAYLYEDDVYWYCNGYQIEELGAITDTVHHLAFTKSGTTHKIYVDGVEVATYTGSSVSVPSTNFLVGGRYDGASAANIVAGTLDSVALYRGSALSAATILAHAEIALGLDGQLAGDRIQAVIDGLSPGPTVSVPSGEQAMAPRQVRSAAAEIDAAAVADGGMCFQEGDGTLRYYSGVRFPPTPRLAPFPARLIGYYALNETSGTAIADSQVLCWPSVTSLGPFDGTIAGGYTLDQATLLPAYPDGKSIDFNGTSGYVSVADAAAFDLPASTDRIVCGAWIRPDNVTAARGIIARSDASNVDWALSITAAGKLLFEMVNSGGTTRSATGATTLTASTTYFVMGSWDGTYCRVFLGTAQDGASSAYASDVPRTSSRAVWIGRRLGGYFDGRIAHAWWGSGNVPSPSQLAAGCYRVGQPRWTFDIGADLPYDAADVIFADERLVRTVRVAPYTAPNQSVAPLVLDSGNSRGEIADVATEAYWSSSDGVTVGPWHKAAAIIERYGTGRIAVTGLTFPVDLDTDLADVVANVELGDRVLVRHTTPGGVNVDTAGWVTGLEHEMGIGGRWQTRLQIEP